MKKYIATIENTTEETTFTVLFDAENNLLVADNGEEIYDMNGEETTDKAIVETVYGLYNSVGFEIVDCIEYED